MTGPPFLVAVRVALAAEAALMLRGRACVPGSDQHGF